MQVVLVVVQYSTLATPLSLSLPLTLKVNDLYQPFDPLVDDDTAIVVVGGVSSGLSSKYIIIYT